MVQRAEHNSVTAQASALPGHKFDTCMPSVPFCICIWMKTWRKESFLRPQRIMKVEPMLPKETMTMEIAHVLQPHCLRADFEVVVVLFCGALYCNPKLSVKMIFHFKWQNKET